NEFSSQKEKKILLVFWAHKKGVLLPHLQQKGLFLAGHFPVFTCEWGELVRSQPFIPSHCFYEGYMEGAPEALVVLSTCSGGLRGLLRIEGMSYGIEPIKASLFMAKIYRGHAGRAYVGGICLVTDAASIVTRHFASVPFFSVTVAHGHNLGMYHHYDKWHCNRSVGCIMAAVHITTDQFTDCSREVYFNLLHDGAGFCLCNIPAPSKIFRRKHCGNKVMEGEEECDCGSELECKKDVLSGKLCRAAVDECDLPEYCNRTSKWCQEDDVYVQERWNSMCHNHNKQCADIFGGGAQKAPLSCFSNLNTRGDRFGNCASGETGANYKKIERWHISNGKICLGRTYASVSHLNFDCDTKKKCNSRGVCTNTKNCHCSYGWIWRKKVMENILHSSERDLGSDISPDAQPFGHCIS
uniref:Peptidase M12B domain-containing protein n=1 Tax=Chelonoidis abingdonii TaxID=106734 RepID=A0A8C0G7Z9_CHEAB